MIIVSTTPPDWIAKRYYSAVCERNAFDVFLFVCNCCCTGIYLVLPPFLVSSQNRVGETKKHDHPRRINWSVYLPTALRYINSPRVERRCKYT